MGDTKAVLCDRPSLTSSDTGSEQPSVPAARQTRAAGYPLTGAAVLANGVGACGSSKNKRPWRCRRPRTVEVVHDGLAVGRADAQDDAIQGGPHSAFAGNERLRADNVGAGHALPCLRREPGQLVQLVAYREACSTGGWWDPQRGWGSSGHRDGCHADTIQSVHGSWGSSAAVAHLQPVWQAWCRQAECPPPAQCCTPCSAGGTLYSRAPVAAGGRGSARCACKGSRHPGQQQRSRWRTGSGRSTTSAPAPVRMQCSQTRRTRALPRTPRHTRPASRRWCWPAGGPGTPCPAQTRPAGPGPAGSSTRCLRPECFQGPALPRLPAAPAGCTPAAAPQPARAKRGCRGWGKGRRRWCGVCSYTNGCPGRPAEGAKVQAAAQGGPSGCAGGGR